MRHLDETDLEILRLLSADARRSFRDIADVVDLSAPAVSDRVSRLEEQGVIRRFTLDVDRTAIEARTPVVVTLEAKPGRTARVTDALDRLDGVEHVFELADGSVLAHATVGDRDVKAWLASELDLADLAGYDVDLVTAYEWTAGIEAADFALECVVCGNEVGDDGVTAEVGGEVKAFCCPSCEARYRERYERHREEAG